MSLTTAHATEFTPIATLGLGVSGNGAVVVGALDDGAQILSSRWNLAGGVQALGQGGSRSAASLAGERIMLLSALIQEGKSRRASAPRYA